MSSLGCIDVCDEVIRRLTRVGFDVGDDEDHDPIFRALEKVEFVPDDGVAKIPKKAGYSERLDGDFQVSCEELIAGILFDYDSGGDRDLDEEECAELGRTIFKALAKRIRPDFFDKLVMPDVLTDPDEEA